MFCRGAIIQETFFFEQGVRPDSVFAGNLIRNLALAGSILGVTFGCRDYRILLEGHEEMVERGKRFLSVLSQMYIRLGRRIEQADFEQILRTFRDRRDSDLEKLFAERIKVSPKKREVMPRSKAQLDYVQTIREKDIVFGIGPAGTGKTYLAMAMAVESLLKEECNRIILTRPAKEAGENLGFLPGSLEEKIMPYLRPLYDALYDMLTMEEANDLISHNVIEVAPLAFMRGRTLNNSFIILDEAQNTTKEQMLMFLTRLGYNSRCVITGDPQQTDIGPREVSGLLHAEQVLSAIPEIAFCHFGTCDVVRHALLEKIINAYAVAGKSQPKSASSAKESSDREQE